MNSDELARAAAGLFVTLAREGLAARGRFAVALSGGSTPRAMHQHLASPAFASQVDWAQVHLFWGDERCVPPDHKDSNYRMARETLLDYAPIPPENIHRIRGEDAPERVAENYEDELRMFFGQTSGGQTHGSAPTFDLIFLGLGDDGHTASIFPGTSAVREERRWVVAQEHNVPPPPLVARITITPPLINTAAQVVFLVAGAGKAGRLKEVLHGPYQPEVLPGQMVRPANGRLVWLVDEAAAQNL
jgi:6-phosphogluconolactonase